VAIGTDYIGSYKSNYLSITPKMDPFIALGLQVMMNFYRFLEYTGEKKI
jgi:hypothetical protein